MNTSWLTTQIYKNLATMRLENRNKNTSKRHWGMCCVKDKICILITLIMCFMSHLSLKLRLK